MATDYPTIAAMNSPPQDREHGFIRSIIDSPVVNIWVRSLFLIGIGFSIAVFYFSIDQNAIQPDIGSPKPNNCADTSFVCPNWNALTGEEQEIFFGQHKDDSDIWGVVYAIFAAWLTLAVLGFDLMVLSSANGVTPADLFRKELACTPFGKDNERIQFCDLFRQFFVSIIPLCFLTATNPVKYTYIATWGSGVLPNRSERDLILTNLVASVSVFSFFLLFLLLLSPASGLEGVNILGVVFTNVNESGCFCYYPWSRTLQLAWYGIFILALVRSSTLAWDVFRLLRRARAFHLLSVMYYVPYRAAQNMEPTDPTGYLYENERMSDSMKVPIYNSVV